MPFEKNNYLIPAFKVPDDYTPPNYSDLKHDYDHPNVNSYEYRTTIRNYLPPMAFPRFFTELDINSEGLFMMATNNFNTNIFDSVIAGTYDFEDFAVCRFDAITLKETQKSNVSILKFMNSNKFLATATGPYLQLYSPQQTTKDVQLFMTAKIRVRAEITCLEELPSSNQIVIGTKGGHMAIIKNEANLELEAHFHKAHCEDITAIARHPTKEQCWISASSDHCCALWDKSEALKASFLVKDHRDRITDVKWLTENSIWASDAGGNVFSIDPRYPKAAVSKQKVATRVISALKFVKDLKTLGVVSDSPELKICRIDAAGRLEVVHEHSARPLIIYSMAWDPKDEKTFYVVGDKQYARKVTMQEAPGK